MELINEINLENLKEISIGAAVLGTGGGGDPKIGYLMAKQAIEKHGPIKIVQVNDIPKDCIVAAVSMMGAPTVSLEKIPNGTEYKFLIDELEKHFEKKIDYLYPVEAGGINSMVPLVAAAQLGLPVIDADTMGRAFPELQMVTFAIYGLKPFPILLCNEKRQKQIIDGDDFYEIENKARIATVEMGATASVGDGIVSGKVFQKVAIKEIISLSNTLGNIVLHSKTPFEDLINKAGGFKLFTGKIINIIRKTEDGFNKGFVEIEGIEEYKDRKFVLHIQNENLIVLEGEKKLCMVPDLVTLLDSQNAMPITTDKLKYGQRVCAMAFKCDEKWRLENGIKLTGPRAFGYDFDYERLEDLVGGKNV